MNTSSLSVLASIALAACSADPNATSPGPVLSAQQSSGSAQDAGFGPIHRIETDGRAPLVTLDPPPRRTIQSGGTGGSTGSTSKFIPTRDNTRWWEQRDAGVCGGAIPVYVKGECDCNANKVCGDGCATSASGEYTIALFCVCGGLTEDKRAASWDIPGFAAKYPKRLCKLPDGGTP